MEQQVLSYIKTELLGESVSINKHTSLFTEGVMDSMALVQLIDYLENNYDIKVSPMEIITEHFDSIEKICLYLKKKGAHA